MTQAATQKGDEDTPFYNILSEWIDREVLVCYDPDDEEAVRAGFLYKYAARKKGLSWIVKTIDLFTKRDGSLPENGGYSIFDPNFIEEVAVVHKPDGSQELHIYI